MNNIHGKNKDIYLSEENRCRTWSIREQPNPERPLLHSIRSCSPAIDSAHFFHWHWINSKNCSLWNKVGLVRTFRIQSQHSRDFQVSSMPKTPSILRTLERTDNLSAQNHSTPPQSYFRMTSRSRCWPTSTSSMIYVSAGMLPILLQEIPRPDHSKPARQVGWSALPPHRPVDNKAGDSLLCQTSISLLNTKVIWKHQNQNSLKNLPPPPLPNLLVSFLVSLVLVVKLFQIWMTYQSKEHRI